MSGGSAVVGARIDVASAPNSPARANRSGTDVRRNHAALIALANWFARPTGTWLKIAVVSSLPERSIRLSALLGVPEPDEIAAPV